MQLVLVLERKDLRQEKVFAGDIKRYRKAISAFIAAARRQKVEVTVRVRTRKSVKATAVEQLPAKNSFFEEWLSRNKVVKLPSIQFFEVCFGN